MNSKISKISISRLPIYLRALQRLQANGKQHISSQGLSEYIGISAAQIRKDLSLFGEFGKQGTGYYVPYLIEQLKTILHLDRIWDVVLVGVGDLGHAIARYQGFTDRGFRIVALFDAAPEKIGQEINGLKIEDTAQMQARIQALQVQIAMLTVPAAAAQNVADQLVAAGIRAILNYAPIHLAVPENVCVEHIDPAIGLQRMTYYIGAAAPETGEAA